MQQGKREESEDIGENNDVDQRNRKRKKSHRANVVTQSSAIASHKIIALTLIHDASFMYQLLYLIISMIGVTIPSARLVCYSFHLLDICVRYQALQRVLL